MERNDLCGLLSMINCKSEEERLIYNAMRVSDNVLYPLEVVLKMYKGEAVKNRTFAMEWMNRVNISFVEFFFQLRILNYVLFLGFGTRKRRHTGFVYANF